MELRIRGEQVANSISRKFWNPLYHLPSPCSCTAQPLCRNQRARRIPSQEVDESDNTPQLGHGRWGSQLGSWGTFSSPTPVTGDLPGQVGREEPSSSSSSLQAGLVGCCGCPRCTDRQPNSSSRLHTLEIVVSHPGQESRLRGPGGELQSCARQQGQGECRVRSVE